MKKATTTTSPEKLSWAEKYATRFYLIILALLFFVNYTRIFDEKIDMNGDNIVYYSLGNALHDGKGFTNTIGFDETPHSHFPPGYPAFIAVMMKLGFTGIHAIKMINGALLFLSMFLLFFLLHMMCKNRLVAFTATAFTISQSTILRFATIMMSEMLFVFFTLIILLIILKFPPEQFFTNARKRWKDMAILAVLLFSFGYIYLIRTMGLSLILAVLVYFGIKSIRQAYGFFKTKAPDKRTVALKYLLITGCLVVAFFVPKVAWDMRNNDIGKNKSDYVGDFQKKLNGQVMSGFTDWKDRVTNNTVTYVTKWIPSAVFSTADSAQNSPGPKGLAGWLKGISIIFLLLLALYKLPQGDLLLFLYAGITMGVLLIWPEQYGGQRYMLPVIPFLIFLTIYGGVVLLRLLLSIRYQKIIARYPGFITFIACGIFTCIAYPSYATSINGMKVMATYKEYVAEITGAPLAEYIQAMQWVKDNIKDDGRVCTRKPELFYIYSKGRKSTNFPNYATPEEIVDYLTKNNIRYLIIDRWFRHAYVTLVPAAQKYPEQFGIIHQIGGKNNEPPTYVLAFRPGITGDE